MISGLLVYCYYILHSYSSLNVNQCSILESARTLARTHLPVVELRTVVDSRLDVFVRLSVGSFTPDHEEVGHDRRTVSHVLYRLSVHYAEVVRS